MKKIKYSHLGKDINSELNNIITNEHYAQKDLLVHEGKYYNREKYQKYIKNQKNGG